MTQTVVKLLLWFSAIGCGLIAGVYFAFSTFIMPALGRIEVTQAVAAMNSMSSTILKSLFMPLFFATTLTSVALVIMALTSTGRPGTVAMVAGGLTYIVGMFLCTAFFNVPLNNRLAAVNPANPDVAVVWARYLKEWTMWNHVRTVAATVSCVLYVCAIVARSTGVPVEHS